MKLLLITRHYPPPVTDGTVRYCQCLAEGLLSAGHHVVVLAGYSDRATYDGPFGVNRGFPVYRYRAVSNLKHRPESWRRFARILETIAFEHEIDCLVIQHPYHAAAAAGAREKLGCPVIFVTHTIAAQRRLLRSLDPGYRHDIENEKRELEAILGADAVICVSLAQKKDLIEIYGVAPERLHFIPTGVPPAAEIGVDPKLSQLAGIRSRGRYLVLYVGRESWEKGTDLLIDIFERVEKVTDKAVFVIAGISRERWHYYLLRPRTQVLPWLDSAQLALLYKLCHILIMPSRQDSMPYVLLEAMANEVVPVVNNIDGLGEVVRHGYNGLKVEVRREPGRIRPDPTALAEAICFLTSNKSQLRMLGANAANTVKEDHSLTHQIMKFTEVAHRLIKH